MKYIDILFLCKLWNFSDDRLSWAEFLGNMNEDQLNALPRWKHDVFYCTCPYEHIRRNKPEEIRECSEDTIVKCAKEDNPALNKNKCQIRNKRSAVKPFSYKMFQRQDIQLSEFTDTEEVCVLSLYSKKFFNLWAINRKYLG